jgi:hypothetical protein
MHYDLLKLKIISYTMFEPDQIAKLPFIKTIIISFIVILIMACPITAFFNLISGRFHEDGFA